RYPVGSKVKGKVTSITDFGVFVEIEEGIEGLIHNSQLGIERDQDPSTVFAPGTEVEADVTNIERDEHRISLSRSSIQQRRDSSDIEGFMQDSRGAVTVGDLLREKMGQDDE